jgi:hypothetical protein
MNFNEIYDEIIQNRENHQQGYFNCIPFMGMERLEKYLPGIEQDTYYILTASSGVNNNLPHSKTLLKLGTPEEDNQLPSYRIVLKYVERFRD